jgi:hypothetical protein
MCHFPPLLLLVAAPTVSIFAFLSLGLFPIPLIFIRYGKQLRARSRYAQEAHKVIMRMGEYNHTEGIEQGRVGDLERASPEST